MIKAVRLAQAQLSAIRPLVDEHEAGVLSRLMQLYNAGGDIPHDALVGALGELAAMRRIINKLDREIRSGNE